MNSDELSEFLRRLQSQQPAYQSAYLAMYSSLWDMVLTDPRLMLIPIDDHMVHRGDGVFEAIKCVGGRGYGLEAHLERLEKSAQAIELKLPMNLTEIAAKLGQTVKASGVQDGVIRLYVSRGPGGFSPNPYESIGSQLYIVYTRLNAPSPELYARGARLVSSKIAPKSDFFARLKSCNYLPNVLMKKESVDRGVDFSVGVTAEGFLTEGATENIGFITSELDFVVPSFRYTLRGITVSRLMELARSHFAELRFVGERDISLSQVQNVKEVLLFGTTIDVLPVVAIDEVAISGGKPGVWSQRFLHLLRQDQTQPPQATMLF